MVFSFAFHIMHINREKVICYQLELGK